MLINARILTLLISEAYDVQEFGRDLKTEELSLPVFYNPGTRLQKGQIYIAKPQDLPAFCNEECIFICAGRQSARGWNSRSGKLLFITDRGLDLLTLFNFVQNIFNRISAWMLKMQELLIENAKIEEYVTASIPVFENCITITDYNLRVLVNSNMTESAGQRRITIDQQFERIPDDVSLTFQKDFISNTLRREPFKYMGQRENPQGENYCVNLFFGDSYIGTCTLWEKLRPLRESDFLLFQQFASFIRRALSSQERSSQQELVSIRTIFSGLLQCFPVSDRDLNQAMTMLQVNMDSQEVSFGSWCCIVIRSANKDKMLPEHYLCASIENILPRCSALFFDQLVVCFCMIPKESPYRGAVGEQLKPYLEDMNFRAGNIVIADMNLFLKAVIGGVPDFTGDQVHVVTLVRIDSSTNLAHDGISINAYTPNAGTRSWFNMLAEYRAEGIDPTYIEAAAPPAQKFPPDRMISVLGYMCTKEFDASGLVVKLGADGEVSLWTNMDKYNTMFKDLWKDGARTVEELRERMPKELLKDVVLTKSVLAVNKGSYD